MDIYEKINAGHYANQDEYPPAPKKPNDKRRLCDIPKEELAGLALEREHYESAKKVHDAKVKQWQEKNGKAASQFIVDLCEEHGLDYTDPFVQALYGVAYEHGHSCGFGDVACYFDDLMPLWKMYAAKCEEAKGGETSRLVRTKR